VAAAIPLILASSVEHTIFEGMSSDGKDARSEAIRRIRGQRKQSSPQQLFADLHAGNRNALAKAITLVESSRQEDLDVSADLLELCMPHAGNARRIGITGVPGVGKSTFIETFGNLLIEKGEKVAVLAVDPSSQRSRGSILGDKTRMELLSRNPEAFIRPSPAADTLGGVARATRESILLCEAAGFTTIIVETVGVGQSETTVYGMVDFFLLLMLSGAGDELQGIKRGIMEMADTLLITKADGDNVRPAQHARRQYKTALHLYPETEKGWSPEVEVCSALEKSGFEDFMKILDRYFELVASNGWLQKHRSEQALEWFHDALRLELLRNISNNQSMHQKLLTIEAKVRDGLMSPFVGARKLADEWSAQST
jgi:LAO/AO transport system kinase